MARSRIYLAALLAAGVITGATLLVQAAGGGNAGAPAAGAGAARAARGAGGAAGAAGGRGAARGPARPATLGLDHGTLDFDTPDFTLKLVKDSQTIAALEPKGAKGYNNAPFDFTPADQLTARAADGFNHLGDVTFRVQQPGLEDGAWVEFSSATARKPVNAISDYKAPAGGKVLAAADISPSLSGARANTSGRGGRGAPAATPVSDCPLSITRSWLLDSTNRLVLHFDIRNKSTAPITLGALGIPVIFNNSIIDATRLDRNGNPMSRSLEQAHNICSFFDPYIGQDGGYLQVTRLNGAGPALVVVPETGTKTPFEAYRKINDLTPTGQTFEGAFEWMVHSQAYAENDWRNAKPWNPGTSETLAPGQTTSVGLRLLVSPEIQDIDKTMAANKRPVVVGVPGYILPMDLNAKLFLNTEGRKVTGIQTDPPDAITATAASPTKTGWLDYTLKGNTWGRVRLTISYDDNTQQSVQYYVTKPAAQAISDLGNFMFTKQWFTDESDPFHRAPSIMTYDRANNKIVTQDTRVWVAGLGDEGGSSWLTGAMKEFGQPRKEEVAKYEQFVDKVLWGGLQLKDGQYKYGVLKSMFYYDANGVPGFTYQQGNWGSWTSWTNTQIHDVFQRAYNYPHVVAAYWALYHLARNNPGLITNHPWQWYLEQAYQTTNFMLTARNAQNRPVGYLNTGLMEGDVFLFLLNDLKREGMTPQANALQTAMKARADRWRAETFPFGSEMAWDSTGQEEVYAWTSFFGYEDKAEVTIDSILGYMPTIPHWGYNGNARRYWDFQYGGAPGGGIERQLHHYGSGINAIPMLAEYRKHPDDLYLLRVGYGGAMGALSNIDQEGFASAAFHSYPQNLRWDAYSGDYAQNFFGHALDAATYVVNSPDFGWLAFGGNLKTDGDAVTVTPLDSFRTRIYLAPLGVYLTLDAGQFQSASFSPTTHKITLTLAPKGEFTPSALLRIEQPAKIEGVGKIAPTAALKTERDAFVVELGAAPTTVELTAK